MLTKTQIIIVVFLLLCQISFSIYYSQSIIKLSQNYNQLEKNVNFLRSQNQQLLNQLSEYTSLSRLKTESKDLLPITKSIDLQP